jgi:hypothetical protein
MSNLLLNGTFSAGITNWNLTTPTATINPTAGIGGTPCAQYTQNNRRIQQNFTLVVGQQYDLIFWLNFQNAGMVCEIRVQDNINSALYVNTSISSNNIGTYIKYTITFTSTGNTSCNLRIRRDSGGGGSNFFIDNVGIYPFGLCYSGNSKVLAKDLTTGIIDEIPAALITSNYSVYDMVRKVFVPVKYNIINGPIKTFDLLKKGVLGHDTGYDSVNHPELIEWLKRIGGIVNDVNDVDDKDDQIVKLNPRPMPSEDFYITRGHKILYNEQPTKIRDVPEAQRKRIEQVVVYSIVCGEQSTILVNNVPTLTFSQEEIEPLVKQNSIQTTEFV